MGALDGVDAEGPPSGLRPEFLCEVDARAITKLARVGRLLPGAVVNVWAGQAPPRWPVGELAAGLAVWALAGVGLWGLVT